MRTKCSITLTPILSNVSPNIQIDVPETSVNIVLEKTETFEFEFNSDIGFIQINFFNKSDNDPTLAVIIENVSFFGISDPKFIWAGVYTPVYPEPWASQQKDLLPKLHGQTYLGWNGTWKLDFTVPVFTWMHKILDLGWIYS